MKAPVNTLYRLAGKLTKPARKKAKAVKKLLFQQYYKTLFFIRRKVLQKYDELTAQKEGYFTVELKRAGFTDQLVKFVVFYNLGKSLNCKYYFTPLKSERSSAITESNRKVTEKEDAKYSDVYDFLGLHDYLKSISVDEGNLECDLIILELDEFFFIERGLESRELITKYLKLKVYPLIKNKEQVHIKIMMEGASSFFGMFNKMNGCPDSGLDFRSAFQEKQKQINHSDSELDFPKCRAMVHIRQGDTAMIKTPWNTYINVWNRFNISMREYENPREARTSENIEIDEYYSFLKSLCDCFEDEILPITVFSDGYKRALEACVLNKNRLGLSESQAEQLNVLSQTYNREAFRAFEKDNRFKLNVGEADTKLFELIRTLLRVRIVVVGTQQRMVPKFLSVYCTSKNMPLVIVLYNKVPPNTIGFTRNELQNHYIFVDINSYRIQDIAARIEKFLETKKVENQSGL